MQSCIQVETISKIKESVALTNKDIGYMTKEISEIKKVQADTNNKIDNNHLAIIDMFKLLDNKLEKKFVLRTEFKVGIGVLSALATII